VERKGGWVSRRGGDKSDLAERRGRPLKIGGEREGGEPEKESVSPVKRGKSRRPLWGKKEQPGAVNSVRGGEGNLFLLLQPPRRKKKGLRGGGGVDFTVEGIGKEERRYWFSFTERMRGGGERRECEEHMIARIF